MDEYTPIISVDSILQPTLPTNSIIRGRYKIIDNTMFLTFFYKHVSGGGVNGVGTYLISLPNGYTPKTYLLNNDSYFPQNLTVGSSTVSIFGLPFIFLDGRSIIQTISTTPSLVIGYSNDNTPFEFWNNTSNMNLTSTLQYEISASCTIPLK